MPTTSWRVRHLSRVREDHAELEEGVGVVGHL